MRGAIPPLSQYAFIAWCSVKIAQGQLYILSSPYYYDYYYYYWAVIAQSV
jgi:hypothetical protein